MSGKSYQRGDAVWYPAPFKNPPKKRLFLILSDSIHPFHGDEYSVVGMTTTNHSKAVEVTQNDWLSGFPGDKGYASPWYIFTIKHSKIDSPQGSLTNSKTTEIANEVAQIIGVL
ncbi:MAG: hypothetical protein ABEK59_07950 [Halobacteria archaeon]